ncbi:Peptide chain release factor 1, mitochondrial [Paramarasmius palmivorus]|uniref:diphosphomevalonate decarboxylase n=1 Tax=Paramarasmius palmivorus TaxID=297713 RepID=A0AAW0EGQ6_9AGAR
MLRVLERRITERTRIQTQLSDDLSSPEDISRLRHLKETESLQSAWDEWITNKKLCEELVPFLEDSDPTMRALAQEDYTKLSVSLASLLSEKFPTLLVPPSSTANLPGALVELKSGRFAANQQWKTSVVSNNANEGGGIKDALIELKGEGAYDTLRWESGVHRVQRVPATEASGRVHTSTVSVIVLPLLDEKDMQKEQLYKMEDVRVEVMRSRGAGGQHVNKTESAVRLTHIPTGITVSMQEERSQHQNKRRAFQVLSSRLMDQKLTREIAERRAAKNNLVKSADRSEKIRTYNYAQERVTDHRIGLSIMNLTSVLEGDALQDFTDALKRDHAQTMMEELLSDEIIEYLPPSQVENASISFIRYWGKRDTKLILPTNSSLSVTLSQDHLRSTTTSRADPAFERDTLWLNGKEEEIKPGSRTETCIREMRTLRKTEVEDKDPNAPKLSTMKLHISSFNNFPTAAGLASSASGFAALIASLSALFQLPTHPTQLSLIARQGSGSACRSLFGGYVAWEMGSKPDGSDSHAVQVAPHTHWPDLHALICVVNDAKKGTSSTSGMQRTVETSPLLQHRLTPRPWTDAIHLQSNFGKGL